MSGQPNELLGPLMRSLEHDLLADDTAARAAFAVPLHGFDAAVEHALREWDELEPRARAMSPIESSIAIAAPPEQVWAVVMDPRRFGDWVTIHRELRALSDDPPREGSTMEQTLHLRGRRHPRAAGCSWSAGSRTTRAGRATARRAPTHISNTRLTATEAGTRFDYQNEFRPPLGAIGALASRTVMGQVPQREADRSLAALRAADRAPSRLSTTHPRRRIRALVDTVQRCSAPRHGRSAWR